MPELVCELITTIDAWARGTKSPGYYGYGGPDFMSWLAKKNAEAHYTLMGRKTLDLLSSLPDAAKDEEYRKMTRNPGWVVSTTLVKSAWPGLEIVHGELADYVRRWKAGDGPEIRTIGSLSLVRQLVKAELVDRLRMIMCPLVLPQTGEEQVFAGYGDQAFDLLGTEVLDGKVIVLDYRPSGRPPRS